MAAQFASVGESHETVRILTPHSDRLRRQCLYAEAPRLRDRAPRQIGAAQPGWKAEVVLDARTGSRLAAGRLPLHHYRLQPFASAINRRPQARRTAADDNQVVNF